MNIRLGFDCHHMIADVVLFYFFSPPFCQDWQLAGSLSGLALVPALYGLITDRLLGIRVTASSLLLAAEILAGITPPSIVFLSFYFSQIFISRSSDLPFNHLIEPRLHGLISRYYIGHLFNYHLFTHTHREL